MKLYRTPAGSWHGTRADAITACLAEGAQRHGYVAQDVPTDKPGLLAWLNARDARPAPAPAAEAPAPIPAPTLALAAPASSIHAAVLRDLTIEEAIADADYPRAIRLAEHVHCRLMEHARKASI